MLYRCFKLLPKSRGLTAVQNVPPFNNSSSCIAMPSPRCHTGAAPHACFSFQKTCKNADRMNRVRTEGYVSYPYLTPEHE